ncbi:TPA: diguanylate cyclase [Clostridioides difficile]|nr:diguanylate cyclase [Clostridioides difficile]
MDILTNGIIDKLTNLNGNYNFRMMLSSLENQKNQYGIMFIGIDDFEQINNLYSYSFGDRVLKKFSRTILRFLPEDVSLYRLDGNGFGILYPNGDCYELIKLFNRFQDVAQCIKQINGHAISFTISGSVCFYPKDGIDCDTLYQNARVTFEKAKKQGKKTLLVYSNDKLAFSQYSIKLIEYLRESVLNEFKGFYLNYQPLILANNKKLYGCEVLLRWKNPNFEMKLGPTEFIPFLESSGLMDKVSHWAIRTALKQLNTWIKYMPNFKMNINVSYQQLEDPSFKFFILDTIKKEGLLPSLITLELTEDNNVKKIEEIRNSFNFLRSQGIKIIFDSFGAKHSSLEIFRELSADSLKINRTLLNRITYDVTDQKIVSQIINLCHSMNMTVYVEGIEDKETLKIIEQMRPEILQGFYYKEPISADKFYEYYFEKGTDSLNYQEDIMSRDISLEKEKSMVYSAFTPTHSMNIKELIDNAYAGIFQVGMDHEFTFLTCNEGYRRMLGYTIKEMEEKFKNQALGFVHPDDIEYVNYEIRRQLGISDIVTIEFRVVKSDGTPIWILGTGNVVKSKQGSKSLIVVIIENDRLKKRSLEMEESYWKYRRVLDNIPACLKCIHFDEDFTLEYISPSFISLIGYTEKEIKNKFDGKYINLIFEEDRKTVLSDMIGQVSSKDIVTLHYRIKCKDKRLISLETISRLYKNDSDGKYYFYSSIVDVTDVVTDTICEEKDKKSNNLVNRYQKALKQWGDILFEYNFKDDTITFSDNYYNIFQVEPKGTITEQLSNIYEDDCKVLLDALEEAQNGHKPEAIEIRIRSKNDVHLWCSIVFNEPDKIGETTISILGKIRNIDEEKKEYNKLIEQSQNDLMTGLLNKSTTEEKIREVLLSCDKSRNYALFMIDVDNFKYVNDTMGHVFGDKILTDLAECLKRNFRKVDIVGRVGGDEFIAFMEYSGEKENIQKKGIDILKRLASAFTYDDLYFDISVSIGISVYPEDGEQFYELYHHADSALYRAKEEGKNTYCMFSI